MTNVVILPYLVPIPVMIRIIHHIEPGNQWKQGYSAASVAMSGFLASHNTLGQAE
jgi:hypothetical protein